MKRNIYLSVFTFLFSLPVWSMYTELGVSYNYKKTTVGTDNYIESQSTTGSLSFYIWERVAIELSYTNGLTVMKEKVPNFPVRTTTQFVDTYGSDLIFSFASRQAVIQPYLKAGTAFVRKKRVIQDDGNPSTEQSPDAAWVPSYGAGIKIMLTETIGLKAGFDTWATPIEGGSKVNDVAGRVGISWIF